MQARDFGELDGIRMAAEMEKRGGAFYRLAARVTRSEATRTLLESLAADEELHLKEFQRLYRREARRGPERYPAETEKAKRGCRIHSKTMEKCDSPLAFQI